MSVDVQAVKSAQDQGLTVGLAAADGSTQLRLEIDEFIQDVDVTNLYLLALIDLMDAKVYEDPFSWYQMGGIHGAPYAPWDGVQATGDPNSGYCSHSSILFPSWHRPYIAMVEQSVFVKMSEIADKFPVGAERTKYEQAVQRFRHPYWDPIMPRIVKTVNGRKQYSFGLPLICTFPTIQLDTPETPGTFVEKPNPLYTFKFPPSAARFDSDGPLAWAATFTSPNEPQSIAVNTIRGINNAGKSDHSYVMNTFGQDIEYVSKRQPQLGGKLYNLLFAKNVISGRKLGFGEFSNDGYFEAQGQQVGNQNSLEGFHDDIHVNCGQGAGNTGDGSNYGMGHMGLIEYAAFDPIFWLHHTNVDRICALYQQLYPTEWFDGQVAVEATFVTAAGTEETPGTELFPFRKSGTRESPVWYISDDVRDCKSLGYDYAIKDTSQNNIHLGSATSATITAWVNRTYQWASLGSAVPPQSQIGYPQNLAHASNLPAVWKIDGVTQIPHDDAAPVVHAIQKKVVAAVAPAAQAVLSTTSTQSSHDSIWVKEQFGHLGDLVKDGKMTQWSVSVVVEKYAIGGSFTIYFFLGDFPEQPAQWPHAQTLAGLDGVLVNKSIRNCANCKTQKDQHLLVSDHIGLTPALVKYWEGHEQVHGLSVTNLDHESVIPFLERNLHWRVANASGQEVDRNTVAGLTVQVNSQVVHLPQRPEDPPAYEALVPWTQVTDGRPAGVSHGNRV